MNMRMTTEVGENVSIVTAAEIERAILERRLSNMIKKGVRAPSEEAFQRVFSGMGSAVRFIHAIASLHSGTLQWWLEKDARKKGDWSHVALPKRTALNCQPNNGKPMVNSEPPHHVRDVVITTEELELLLISKRLWCLVEAGVERRDIPQWQPLFDDLDSPHTFFDVLLALYDHRLMEWMSEFAKRYLLEHEDPKAAT